ncbi:peptide chain release factor N(5)-glutamine methyltransferase [Olivibacter ginsenosidimutans]|uniref:Release factor glutamine methyltransferase n=1 Tax=Olivibacter ginsenosidimutans TaxID=1176537 RepID=A0ABP9BDY5_9SPHI
MTQTFKTIRQRFLNTLSPTYGESEAESVFIIVLEDVFHYKRTDYLLGKPLALSAADEQQLEKILVRLRRGEPIQQIIGSTQFMGISLKVTKDVLIPRPETEELVDLILQDQQADRRPELRIIDIGTGTGCIPIALKKHLPEAHITALDISKEALEVAKYNALNNNTLIHFILADILEWDLVFTDEQYWDIMVSNPPYITHDEKWDMQAQVLEFEPHLALFVENKAPLLFYETIASFALQHLQPNGLLYVEINQKYGQEVKTLLQKKGFSNVSLFQDIHGADRMIKASLSSK